MNVKDEDFTLIEKFKAGELESFDALVLKYQTPVFNLIYRFTGGSREAEDMAQDIFVKLYKALPAFKGQSSLFTYLYRITLNHCLKARKRAPEVALDDVPVTSGETPESQYLKREILERVRQALSALSPDYRAVIILTRYHNLSYQEIAQILKISLPAVKSRLHKAMLKLKALLQPKLEFKDNYAKV